MDVLSPIIGDTAARIVILAAVLLLIATLVLLLVGLALRIFRGRAFGLRGSRNRAPRLSVPDVLPVDSRRKLILVRRDTVEHLLLVGGATDVVIEQAIQRNVQPAQRGRPPAQAGAAAPIAPPSPAPAGMVPQNPRPAPSRPVPVPPPAGTAAPKAPAAPSPMPVLTRPVPSRPAPGPIPVLRPSEPTPGPTASPTAASPPVVSSDPQRAQTIVAPTADVAMPTPVVALGAATPPRPSSRMQPPPFGGPIGLTSGAASTTLRPASSSIAPAPPPPAISTPPADPIAVPGETTPMSDAVVAVVDAVAAAEGNVAPEVVVGERIGRDGEPDQPVLSVEDEFASMVPAGSAASREPNAPRVEEPLPVGSATPAVDGPKASDVAPPEADSDDQARAQRLTTRENEMAALLGEIFGKK